MTDIMVDLETLDTNGYALITSIAAVEFDIQTGDIGSEFFTSIDIQKSLDEGFTVKASTILWWMEQSEESRNKLISDNVKSRNMTIALDLFEDWLIQFNKGFRIWGRGPRMDLGLLSNAYFKMGYQDPPWNFRDERCVRTMEMLAPEIKESWPKIGIEHNGPDDCKYQIGYTSAIYRKINNIQ